MTLPVWLLIALLPWIAVALVVTFGVRDPRPLADIEPTAPGAKDAAGSPGEPLSVAIVLPARNEARNIEACLRTLAAQDHSSFSITVVDDRSTDGTGDLARSVSKANARAIRVIEGKPLPEGWFGKPWACSQGAADAESDLLLFTDADTRHLPSLLRRCVDDLSSDGADALSLIGTQELRTFWERLLQPQVFALLGLRFRRMDRPLSRENSHDAIANGQYLLVRREAYVAIGGHGAVSHEVVEDLRLAQILTESGYRLVLRDARKSFSTRMYESLPEIIQGWTKNVAVGARQASGWWSALALPSIVVFLVLLWMVPAALFAWTAAIASGALGPLGIGTTDVASANETTSFLLTWSGAATAIGLLLWARLYAKFEVPLRYALLFPLGAAMAAYIVLRSWVRGERRIEWKGRRYEDGKRIE